MLGMSSISGDDQSSPEKFLTKFLTLAVNSTGAVDAAKLADKLRGVSSDRQLQCLSSVRNKNGAHIIHEAARRNMAGVVDCIRTYLRSEQFYTLVDQEDKIGWLPLHHAFASVKRGVSLKSVEKMVDLLLDSFDDVGRSQLIKQAISGVHNLLILAAFVEAPSLALKVLCFLSESDQVKTLRTKDPQDNTALHWLFDCPDESNFTKCLCTMIPHQQMVELLKAENMQGFTPLHMASNHSGNAFPSLLLILKQEEVEYFAGRSFGEFPFLHWLAGCSEQEYLVLMVERLSDEVLLDLMCQTNLGGLTLFHLVSGFDKVKVLEAVSTRVPPDQLYQFLIARDELEKCPLHYAVENEAWSVVNFLTNELPCKHLVKLLDMRDVNGNTPFNSIIEKGNEEFKTLLLQKIFLHLSTTQQAGGKGNTGHYDSEARYERPEREFEDDLGCNSDVIKEVISLQERISELETQLKVKDSLVEDLHAKIIELEEKLNTNAEAAEGDKSEDEGSFDNSSDDDSFTIDPNYTNNALPEDLRQAILDVCDKRKVRNPRILQGLLDYKEVTVVGIGVWQFEDGDLTEIKERWPDNCNSISVLEEESDESDEEFYGNRSSGISKFLLNQPPPVDGICELVVEVDHEELGQKTAYLVGAAHCILSAERVQQLRDGVPPSQVRQQLDADARGCHYRALFRTSPHEEVFVDAFHVPCFGYRRTQGNVGQPRLNADGIDLQRCRNDMALLRIDPSKADKLYHVFRDLEGRRDKHVKINRQMLEKFTRPPVQEGNRIRISVNNQDGFLVPYRNADGQLEPGDVYHLRFVLDIDGHLGPGDSGRVVYKVGTTNGQRSLRPLGLFVGRSRRRVDVDGEQQTVYLAVFIDLAFQDIIDEYEKIRSIYLKGSFKKGPRLERPPTTTRPAATNLPR